MSERESVGRRELSIVEMYALSNLFWCKEITLRVRRRDREPDRLYGIRYPVLFYLRCSYACSLAYMRVHGQLPIRLDTTCLTLRGAPCVPARELTTMSS